MHIYLSIMFRSSLLVLCIVFFLTITVFPSSNEQELLFNYYAIEGTASPELRTALNNRIVQRLLLDIAIKPRPKNYIETSLKETNTSLEQLETLNLIQRQADRFVISFLLFTKKDTYRMREITESHAQILANSLLKHRGRIEKILKQYNLPGVDPHAALYIILGCFSLDWDGLALTAERGYRRTELNNSSIVIWGGVPTKLSRKYFYKGSHNSSYGITTLTCFGDHSIQPREALPDVLWWIKKRVAQVKYPDTLKLRIQDLVKTSIGEIGEQIGLMMLELRDGKKKLHDLALAASIKHDKAQNLTDFLITLGYIKEDNNFYQSLIPILSLRDSSLIKQIRRIGREEMENWLEFEYPRLQKELMDLAPFRCGVKQKDFFYQIWHDIFGATNRMLVKAGLFADPYSKLYGAKGIIPVVFISSLYEKP